MSNIIIPRMAGTQSKSGWVEDRNRALNEWFQKRLHVKKLAYVYQPSRDKIRHALEDVDEWIEGFGFDSKVLRTDKKFRACLFDFELDRHFDPDVRQELPDDSEATHRQVVSSVVPRGEDTPSIPKAKVILTDE